VRAYVCLFARLCKVAKRQNLSARVKQGMAALDNTPPHTDTERKTNAREHMRAHTRSIHTHHSTTQATNDALPSFPLIFYLCNQTTLNLLVPKAHPTTHQVSGRPIAPCEWHCCKSVTILGGYPHVAMCSARFRTCGHATHRHTACDMRHAR
jgi:hypothetical protein